MSASPAPELRRSAPPPAMPRAARRALGLAIVLACGLVAGACQGTRLAADPILEVRGPEGLELAVSTDHGVVFLGRTVRAGEVELVAWFGDGPSVEPAVVEPIGGGLYTAAPEIRLPAVPLSYRSPAPGSTVILVGRRGAQTYEERLTVRADARVEGLLLEPRAGFGARPDALGAGLFVEDSKGRRQLVGLLSGVLELEDAEGNRRAYLTAYGPERLWRLVAHRRDATRRRRFIHRDDIL